MNEVVINTGAVYKSNECYWKPSEEAIKSGAWSYFTFFFTDNVLLTVSSFWRIKKDNEIYFISTDNGHLFGRQEPVDLAKEIDSFLSNKKLRQIKIQKDTADLVLFFEDNIVMEVFTSSMGYESYNLKANKSNYIGMGGGEFAEFASKN